MAHKKDKSKQRQKDSEMMFVRISTGKGRNKIKYMKQMCVVETSYDSVNSVKF